MKLVFTFLVAFLLCFQATSSFADYYAPAIQYSTVQAQRTTTTIDPISNLYTATFASTTPPAFASVNALGPNDVVVAPDETFQPYLGCGGALTEASAYCMTYFMTSPQRTALLTTMFSPSQMNFSFVRICMGSGDFRSEAVGYTYDDMPSGQTDSALINFSTINDTKMLVPILQQILAINPRVKILATVWSPPFWMLSSGTFENSGGVFNNANFTAYANYFVNFIKEYKKKYGIPIWAVTPQNEPGGSVDVTFSGSDEATFIKVLGPAIAAAGLNTKILCGDDSWNSTTQSIITTVFADTAATQWCVAAAWHGYGNGPDRMNIVHGQYLWSEHYETEWRSLSGAVGTSPAESLYTDLSGMAGGWVIGGARNWSRCSILWNLALDETGFGGYAGSWANRRGVVIINSTTGNVTFNPEFYAQAHLSKFLQIGAVRCQSSNFSQPYISYVNYPNDVTTTAFLNPDGSIVLYAFNGASTPKTFQIIDARSSQGFPVTMAAGELSTFVWGTSKQLSPSRFPEVTTTPSTPVLTATANPGQINLSWTTPPSSGPIAWYTISRGTSPGTETQLAQVPASTTTYNDLLGAVGTYYYQVQAVSSPGGYSSISAEQTATSTSNTVPGVPSSLSAAAATGAVKVSWAIPATNGSAITSYNVLRGTSSGTETALGTAIMGSTSYTDSTATISTPYFYEVAAVNSTGTGSNSTEVSGQFQPPAQDAVSTAVTSSSGSTFTWTHTVGSLTHGALYVAINYTANGTLISSITDNNVAMTLVGTADVDNTSGQDRSVAVYCIANPPAGTNTIIAAPSHSGTALLGLAVSYANVSQTTLFRTIATSASSTNAPSMTTTSGAAGDVVLSFLHMRGSNAVTATGSGQSIIESNVQASTNQALLSSQAGGTGSIVSSWSWTTADKAAGISFAVLAG